MRSQRAKVVATTVIVARIVPVRLELEQRLRIRSARSRTAAHADRHTDTRANGHAADAAHHDAAVVHHLRRRRLAQRTLRRVRLQLILAGGLRQQNRLRVRHLLDLRQQFRLRLDAIDVLALLKVLVLRVRIRQIVVLVLVTPAPAEVAGYEADEQREYRTGQHGHHQRLDGVLRIDDVRRDLRTAAAVEVLVLHDVDHLAAGAVQILAGAAVMMVAGMVEQIGIVAVALLLDGAGVFGRHFAGWTGGMLAGGDILVEIGFLQPARRSVRSAFAGDLVPGAVRVLEGDAFGAAGDLDAVAAMQLDGYHLAVGDDDQFAVVVAALLRVVCGIE